MLVLTRKMDEQILIGDNIRVKLIKTRGNTVRIGIEAPREIRVVRGELAERDSAAPAPDDDRSQPSQREQAFAHPPQGERAQASKGAAKKPTAPRRKPLARRSGGLADLAAERSLEKDPTKLAASADPQLLVGSVGRSGERARLRRAPLGGLAETN